MARNPHLAVLLSFIIPGIGQLYNKEDNKGLVLLILAGISIYLTIYSPYFWIAYSILWIYGIYDAYTTARMRKKITI